jgi:hypothetical protein
MERARNSTAVLYLLMWLGAYCASRLLEEEFSDAGYSDWGRQSATSFSFSVFWHGRNGNIGVRFCFPLPHFFRV